MGCLIVLHITRVGADDVRTVHVVYRRDAT